MKPQSQVILVSSTIIVSGLLVLAIIVIVVVLLFFVCAKKRKQRPYADPNINDAVIYTNNGRYSSINFDPDGSNFDFDEAKYIKVSDTDEESASNLKVSNTSNSKENLLLSPSH